jgi:hypothetical protein
VTLATLTSSVRERIGWNRDLRSSAGRATELGE